MPELRKPILVVEDDDAIRNAIKDFLEAESHEVHVAVNGEQGLECLERIGRPCLIFLDLFMPVMNGNEFLRALAAKGAGAIGSQTIVIMTAAPVGSAAVTEALRYSPNLLTKPIDMTKFLALIDHGKELPVGGPGTKQADGALAKAEQLLKKAL